MALSPASVRTVVTGSLGLAAVIAGTACDASSAVETKTKADAARVAADVSQLGLSAAAVGLTIQSYCVPLNAELKIIEQAIRHAGHAATIGGVGAIVGGAVAVVEGTSEVFKALESSDGRRGVVGTITFISGGLTIAGGALTISTAGAPIGELLGLPQDLKRLCRRHSDWRRWYVVSHRLLRQEGVQGHQGGPIQAVSGAPWPERGRSPQRRHGCWPSLDCVLHASSPTGRGVERSTS